MNNDIIFIVDIILTCMVGYQHKNSFLKNNINFDYI